MTPSSTTWNYRFAFLPHRCFVSKEWIWGKMHYKVVDVYDTSVGFFSNSKWVQKELAIQLMLIHGKCNIEDATIFLSNLHVTENI